MRLNDRIREAIVEALVADLPRIDYHSQLVERMQAIAVERLPRLIKTAWDDPDMQCFVRLESLHICCISAMVPGPRTGADRTSLRAAVESDAVWADLHKKFENYQTQLNDAVQAMHEALRSVSTTEKFVELYPDLGKYVPAKDTTKTSLPARTDVMNKLKAAGLNA